MTFPGPQSLWRGVARGAILLALLASWGPAAVATTQPFPIIGTTAPDFTLTSQSGRTVRLSQFRGRIVLLNFIYTHCVDVCPVVTANLARVQRDLIARGWWGKDVVFVSVTTDPARDTPAVLKAYAGRYHADPQAWYFLTGSPGALAPVYQTYGITIEPQAKGLQAHALPTFLIDRSGTVLGAYGVTLRPTDVLNDLEHLR